MFSQLLLMVLVIASAGSSLLLCIGSSLVGSLCESFMLKLFCDLVFDCVNSDLIKKKFLSFFTLN